MDERNTPCIILQKHWRNFLRGPQLNAAMRTLAFLRTLTLGPTTPTAVGCVTRNVWMHGLKRHIVLAPRTHGKRLQGASWKGKLERGGAREKGRLDEKGG